MGDLPAYEFTNGGLTAAAHALGDTAPKVHESLFTLGVRGRRGCESNCPLAEYVKRAVRDVRIVYVYLDEDRDAHIVAESRWGRQIEAAGLKACGQFVRRHDAGLYPDLIEEEPDDRAA
jgi:hypothetical protein